MNKPSHPSKIDTNTIIQDIFGDEDLILKKIARSSKLSESNARVALSEAIKFLYLIAYFNQKLTPSHLVDLAWHEFILFTRQYISFCEKHFGRYIHHAPGGDNTANKAQFRQAISLYELCYGMPPKSFWPVQTHSACGNCASEKSVNIKHLTA